MAVIVIAWAALRPEAVGIEFEALLAGTVGYLALSTVVEICRRTDRWSRAADCCSWSTACIRLRDVRDRRTQSPIRFLVYLDLVAVSLLASYRTGLKIALWDSLLLFVMLYAQAANLVPPVEVVAGAAIEFDRMPVLNVTSFWLFAIATSAFSALNERELRQRRSDLQSMVEVGGRLDDASDPLEQARIVLAGLVERFDFKRGIVLGASDGRMIALATHETETVPTTAAEPDWIVARAWERHDVLPIKRLDAIVDPFLAAAMPNAHNLLVAPMIADGRPVGATVVEAAKGRRLPGVERRVASMVARRAVARSARLALADVPTRWADPRPAGGQPADVPASLERTLECRWRRARRPDHRDPVHRSTTSGRQRHAGSCRGRRPARGRHRAD